VICRTLSKAGFPSIEEPHGLLRSANKRPNGLTLTPSRDGRCATWDVTVTDIVAPIPEYVILLCSLSSCTHYYDSDNTGALQQTHLFVPVSIEMMRSLALIVFIVIFSSLLLLYVGPIASALSNKFGCRIVCMVGSAIAGIFFFISAFSTNMEMLLITYGVMGGEYSHRVQSTGYTTLHYTRVISDYCWNIHLPHDTHDDEG